MHFEIFFSETVKDDFKKLRAYDRKMLFELIDSQLSHSPNVEAKKRKQLHNLVPPFEAVAPIWQLRIGAFRIFYDVNEQERRVYVRAIRRKPAHTRTEEIL